MSDDDETLEALMLEGGAGLDYPALLAEGTALVQRLTGKIWTNYNWSDPGVTILQQLCYALTELSYRADFPVADLLADPATGQVELRRQALHPAQSIMPVNPVTANDLRRLIVDRVPDVGNAWFTRVPVKRSGQVNGLYRIDVLVPALDPGCENEGPDPDRIRNDVLDAYAAHRALCEDVAEVVILRPIRTCVASTVQLDDRTDPDQVLAELLFRLGLALAPEPRRRSLDQLRLAGLTTADIFNGPLMLRGFIEDNQLTPLPDKVPVEYLLEVMAEVPGVLSVDWLRVAAGGDSYRPGDTIDVRKGHILWIDADAREEGKHITLRHGTSVCHTDPVRVQRRLKRLWADQRRTYDLRVQYARDYAPPEGRQLDLAAYSSVQDQFPAVYGIGAFGLPPGSTIPRQATARQLKGYLMVFDQLMADFFAQLAFVRDLFSARVGGDKTYVSQSLRGIVPDAAPLLAPGYELGLKALTALQDPVLARQTMLLDFLLSLYAETLTLPADAACGDVPQISQALLVKAKKALLARIVPATRDRGRGFDYRRAGDDSALDRLEIRARIELALLDATSRRDGAVAVDDPKAASFGWLLPPELGVVVTASFLRVDLTGAVRDGEAGEGASPLAGETVASALLPALADAERYRVGALPGGGSVYLVCVDLEDRCWVIGELRDIAQAIALTHRLLRATGEQCHLTVVEWTLLRYAREYRRHQHGHPHHEGAEPAPDPTPDPDAPSPYSFRISAVMPAGDGDRDDGWRQQAIGIVRDAMPAHVAIGDLFLHPRAMRHFRNLHRAWVRALRKGEAGPRAKASWHLQRFLERARYRRFDDVPDPPIFGEGDLA